MNYENLEIGKAYNVNGMEGMIYKYSIFSGKGMCMQHWFFHVRGHFTHSLRDNEIPKFVK